MPMLSGKMGPASTGKKDFSLAQMSRVGRMTTGVAQMRFRRDAMANGAVHGNGRGLGLLDMV